MLHIVLLANKVYQILVKLVKVDNPQKDPNIERLFAEAIKDWGIRYTPLGKVVRFFYRLIKGRK